MTKLPITTYYLEMFSKDALNPKTNTDPDFVIREATVKQFKFNRFLYELVGEAWQWQDKLSWSDEVWRNYAQVDNLRTFVAYKQGSPAGYFELQKQADAHVELAYFGLAPAFIGQGYGGHLLSSATNEAWAWDAKRVWVHTCSLDHPSALKNYQARGFTVYKEITD